MSEEGISKHDQVLAGLIVSLQAAAMQQLGKVVNPLTGKVERDLEQARGTIDLLEMLKVKCREQTPEPILRMLDTAVMELQMNYLDEMKMEATAQEATEEAADEASGEAAPDADAGPDKKGAEEEAAAGEETAEQAAAESDPEETA